MNELDNKRDDKRPVSPTFPKHAPRFTDMLGVEVRGYRVERLLPYVGSQTRWEVACVGCGRLTAKAGCELRRAQSGKRSLPKCACLGSLEYDTSLVEERLDVTSLQARTLVAVCAHERAFRCGSPRKALLAFLRRDPESMALVRRGLLVYTGHPVTITASQKTWKAMRPEDEVQC